MTCRDCHPTGYVLIKKLVRRGVMREVLVRCKHTPDGKAAGGGK